MRSGETSSLQSGKSTRTKTLHIKLFCFQTKFGNGFRNNLKTVWNLRVVKELIKYYLRYSALFSDDRRPGVTPFSQGGFSLHLILS